MDMPERGQNSLFVPDAHPYGSPGEPSPDPLFLYAYLKKPPEPRRRAALPAFVPFGDRPGTKWSGGDRPGTKWSDGDRSRGQDKNLRTTGDKSVPVRSNARISSITDAFAIILIPALHMSFIYALTDMQALLSCTAFL